MTLGGNRKGRADFVVKDIKSTGIIGADLLIF